MNKTQPDKPDLPLKEAIRQRFEAETLGNEQLQSLMSMQARVLDDSGNTQIPSRQVFPYKPIAACALLLLTIALLWQTTAQRQDTTHQIALEVAGNHLELKPLDITAQTMNEVRVFSPNWTSLRSIPNCCPPASRCRSNPCWVGATALSRGLPPHSCAIAAVMMALVQDN